MIDLVVATKNRGKLREISRLFERSQYQVVGLETFPDAPEIIEDGDTFTANALKKAEVIASYTGMMTLADDSGLVVDALNGAPGVHSARFAGEDATDSDNNQKLLEELKNIPDNQRQAAFHCVMALVEPSGLRRTFEGKLKGMILSQLQGGGGFGYDPLFMVREYGQTLAELSLDVKNRISHRGQALAQVIATLG